MTEKLQQLTDKLEKELSALNNAIYEKLHELEESARTRCEELRAYLITQGMPDKWHVGGVIGSWYANIEMGIEMGTEYADRLARIVITKNGIAKAQLEELRENCLPPKVSIAVYEEITRDFTAGVNFFKNLDYKALDKKVRELDFYAADDLSDQLKSTRNLNRALYLFTGYMKGTGK